MTVSASLLLLQKGLVSSKSKLKSDAKTEPEDTSGSVSMTTGKRRALVVEDDAQVRQFVVEILRRDGWEVVEAETATQALEMLDQDRLSLVFCDVMLGGASGFDVLRRFRE